MSGTTGRTDEGHGRLGSTLSGLAVALGCVLFLGGFVWGAIAYAPYTVPTDSMAPTITSGDRILAERIDGAEIKRGDVVVFRQETWGNSAMVKRVVAVGGDTVACCTDGKLTVNGKKIDEAYLPEGQAAELTGIPEIEVPKGRLRSSSATSAAAPGLHRPPHRGRQRHGAACPRGRARGRRRLAHGGHAGLPHGLREARRALFSRPAAADHRRAGSGHGARPGRRGLRTRRQADRRAQAHHGVGAYHCRLRTRTRAGCAGWPG